MNVRTKPSRWLKIGLGVRAAGRYEVHAEDDAWPFTLDLTAEVEGYRVVVNKLSLERREGAEEGLTPNGLRAVPLGQIVKRAIAASVKFVSSPDPTMSAEPSELEPEARLKRAAVIYRLAALEGEPATEAVAKDLQVSRATAGRLIAQARREDVGLLGPAIGTKAGEES